MKYLYYPGCSLKGTAREYEESFKAVSPALGIEFEEIRDWACCGATVAKSMDKKLSETLPSRALLQADREGLDLLMLCPSCHLNHQALGQKGRGGVRIKQLLEVLTFDVGVEKIKSQIRQALSGIRVLPYYGCLVIRPYALGGKESLENPKALEKIIEAVGGEAVSFPGKMDCCGGGLMLSKEKIAWKLGAAILREARRLSPDCLAVACPLCHFMLDARQRTIERETGEKIGLPVLYITQLLGIGLGVEAGRLGLERLITPAKVLLKKLYAPKP